MGKGVVLVVDDEVQIRDILAFYLKRAGYQVLLAEHGLAALNEIAKVQPDLILSDLRMPEMPGDDLCLKLKGDPKTRDIYFILVSAIDGAASKIGGLNLGADDMIAKPFHAQEVMAKVESAFRLIAMQKEIKRQNLELTRYQERMTAELSLAAQLQMGLLPAVPGRSVGLCYTHRYLPAEGIGGDIYSIVPVPDGGTALLIADVSGHGVTAALISAMVKTSFEAQVRLGGTPLDWANGMNRDLAQSTLAEQFATAFLAHLDPKDGLFRYVVAGHERPILIPLGTSTGSKLPIQLPGKGFMLGIDESLTFSEEQTTLATGDRLILFTDGLVEVEREDRSLLGQDGLIRLCATLPANAEQAADQIIEQVCNFNAPQPFLDDVTLVVIDRCG